MTLLSNYKVIPTSIGPKRLTYRQFLTDPTVDPHSEWVDGEIVAMAPISNEHQSIGTFLLALLQIYVSHKGLGFVRYEPFQMKTRAPLFLAALQILCSSPKRTKNA